MLRKLLRRSTAAAHVTPPQSHPRAQAFALVHTNAREKVADADEHRSSAGPKKTLSDGHVLLNGARNRVSAGVETQPSDGHILLNGARSRAPSASAQATESTTPSSTHLSPITLSGTMLGATAKDIEAYVSYADA